jgi:hypothetical protein
MDLEPADNNIAAEELCPAEDENSIEMILRRKLMFYIEDSTTGPFTVDTGISIERICNESSMDMIKAFIDKFNATYSDAEYSIIETSDNMVSVPNLLILVTPTP